MKPFSETAEENKTLVFPVIEPYLQGVATALEIASGTGQQVVYFAEKTPEIIWQPSDLLPNIPGVSQWVEAAGLQNVRQPEALDVASSEWPIERIEFVYTSNSLHIMSWVHVKALYLRLGELMESGAFFCVYGPFSFAGKHVSDSNLRFDRYLKQRDANSGVRDINDLKALGAEHGLMLQESVEMPHNNHILVWQKT